MRSIGTHGTSTYFILGEGSVTIFIKVEFIIKPVFFCLAIKHKKAFTVATIAFACVGFLWTTIGQGAVVWFVVVAMASAFLERFWTGTVFAIMADSTPLAMSSTVYQMYMSWSWIGNIPSSVMIGYLLDISLGTTALITSSLMIVPLILGNYIKPFEAGKASDI